MLSIQLINHVHLVLVVAQQKARNQLNVITALEEEKLELTKVFLRFNKLALSAVAMERQLANHVLPAVATVKSKLMKM